MKIIKTGRYTIKAYLDINSYYVALDGDRYGLLITDESAEYFAKILDIFGSSPNSTGLDREVHHYYQAQAAKLDQSGMVRPLN